MVTMGPRVTKNGKTYFIIPAHDLPADGTCFQPPFGMPGTREIGKVVEVKTATDSALVEINPSEPTLPGVKGHCAAINTFTPLTADMGPQNLPITKRGCCTLKTEAILNCRAPVKCLATNRDKSQRELDQPYMAVKTATTDIFALPGDCGAVWLNDNNEAIAMHTGV